MTPAPDRALVQAVHDAAHRLEGGPDDFAPVLDRVGDARFVLIGEASHGTHEFYRIRAELTKRLVVEKGFTAVAVEADWPDAYRVNRFVRALPGADPDATGALAGFARFPQWMWRNADVLDFTGWLRAHNDARPAGVPRVGFYGLDLYSLHRSIEAVVRYLDEADPEAAARARARYACFDHFGEDPQAYGYATTIGMSPSCEREAIEQLVELRRAAEQPVPPGHDHLVADARFFAEQNARVVRNAERYYRAMFGGRTLSWNLRDAHMAETLDALVRHLATDAEPPKVVVWAHNSHLGDARATEMGEGGELNLGQLVRERHGADAVLVGFTTSTGTVTAAHDWDGPAERMRVRPPLDGSVERLFQETGLGNFLLDLGAPSDAARRLDARFLHRAIGVIYRPRTERLSHYFHVRLAAQYDLVLHYDVTRAVEPLERSARWERGELAETYPSGY